MASPQGLKIPRVFQVQVEMKTNVGLQIVSKDYIPSSKDIIENSKPYTHKIMMEIPANHPLELANSAGVMNQLMGSQGLSSQVDQSVAQMKELFLSLFIGDDFNWFISDFDNLMMGNNFK